MCRGPADPDAVRDHPQHQYHARAADRHGLWSEEAFRPATREGIARDGSYLYPAFPYDHYAKLGDGDIHALYAFVMTRATAKNRPPPNELPFPLSIRRVVAIWDLLYFDAAPFRPDPDQPAQWNRGAYLVQGLGHCGGCHTPGDFLGAEESGSALAGGRAEGWYAPALNAASPAPVPWDAEHLFAYLQQGWDVEHGAAAGPMQPVTDNVPRAKEQDVRAISTYIASLQGPVSPERRRRADELLENASRQYVLRVDQPPGDVGAAIFAGACARCHAGGPSTVPPRGIDLALSSALRVPDPSNAIFITVDGVHPPEGQRGPFMPGFGGAFTDGQMAALLGYLGARYSGQPAWDNLEARIHELRRREQS